MGSHDEDLGDALSGDALAFLDSVRDADRPSRRDRARVRRAVTAAVATTSAAAATSAVASSAAASSVVAGGASGLSIAGKLAVVAMVVTGVSSAVVLAPRLGSEEPAQAETVTTTAPTHVTDEPRADRPTRRSHVEPVEVAADLPLPEPSRPEPSLAEPAPTAPSMSERAPATRARPRVARAVPPPPATEAAAAPAEPAASTLAEEVVLMRAIHAGVARGEHAQVLDRIAEHERRFPDGALAAEREAARVIATCGAGSPAGRALAERFASQHPSHPLTSRVASVCAVVD